MTPLHFFPMETGPTCVMDIDLGVLAERIRRNCARPLPWLHHLPEHAKSKGGVPVALVSGGPSFNQHLYELRKFDTILACGSAHDHLIEMGFRPRYAVISDSSPLVLEWLTKPNPLCTYLISTSCDDAVFERLQGFPVALWNALGGVPLECFGDYPAIGGGCTVTLRAICLGMVLGYRNQHFFGFDSCFLDDKSHSYIADKGHRSDPSIQDRITVRIGGPQGREYTVTPSFLAQASNFGDMVKLWGPYFDPTVYGNGMIAEMLRTGQPL